MLDVKLAFDLHVKFNFYDIVGQKTKAAAQISRIIYSIEILITNNNFIKGNMGNVLGVIFCEVYRGWRKFLKAQGRDILVIFR